MAVNVPVRLALQFLEVNPRPCGCLCHLGDGLHHVKVLGQTGFLGKETQVLLNPLKMFAVVVTDKFAVLVEHPLARIVKVVGKVIGKTGRAGVARSSGSPTRILRKEVDLFSGVGLCH